MFRHHERIRDKARHSSSVDSVRRLCCYAGPDPRATRDWRRQDGSLSLHHSMRLSRAGFTLVELIVAVAIAGVAAVIMTATLVRQQKFFSSAGEVLAVRSHLRDGADILATDIRSASVAQFGLPVMTDTAIEMITVVAASVVCTSASPTSAGLPPVNLVSGNTLTSMLAPPDTGDMVAVYTMPGGIPDSARWDVYRIAGFASRSIASTCPSSAGFVTPGDEFTGATGFLLTLASGPPAPLRTGSIVHFLRRARYSLYRSSDGDWYLGYRRCGSVAPHACGAIQPVSGPYAPHRANNTSGISFRYYDEAGAEVAAGAGSSVARIDIVLRGETQSAISLAGDARRVWDDSVIVSVSPRNRAR